MSEAVKEAREAGEAQYGSLRKVANAFNNSLIIGASQAADYIMGTPLARFSRDCVFINTNRRKKRTGIKKPTSKLINQAQDDTDVFEMGLIENYESRPKEYKNECLIDFAATCTRDYKYKPEDFGEKGYKKIKNLDKAKIVRFVGFKKEKNEIEYYREGLMLCIPWTNEQEELEKLSFKELKEKYEANEELIVKKLNEYTKILEIDLETLKKKYLDAEEDENDDKLGGFFQHRRDNDSDDENEDFDAFPDTSKKGNKKSKDSNTPGPAYHVSLAPRVPDEDIEKFLENFNNCQRKIVYSIYDAFQQGKKDLKIFLTGTAGKNFYLK